MNIQQIRRAGIGMQPKRLLSLGVAAAVIWSMVVVMPARSDTVTTTDLGDLRRGRPLFAGPVIAEKVTANLDCTPGKCWRYIFDVQPGGQELRVAVQTSRRGDFWIMSLTDPDGNAVEGNRRGASNAPYAFVPGAPGLGDQRWAIEQRIAYPMPGKWAVEVNVQDTEVGLADVGEPLQVRLRAALDPDPDGVFGLPNLRPRPPYEFGLAAPANPTSGAAVDRQNPALSVGGVQPASCTSDEVLLAAEDGEVLSPTQCLRFSVGVYEAGSGRLELQLNDYVPGPFTEEGQVTQRIHYANRRIVEKEAGGWEFHKTHGHPHYLDLVRYELDRVTFDLAGSPILQDAGGSGKTGYNTADQRIADWTSFSQDAQWDAISSCVQDCIALGAGWEDHYRWQRPGQYVALGLDAGHDGLYIVRLEVNADKLIHETTTGDNTAYALVYVAGGAVKVCERGLGDHPWAANAEPVDDEWPAVRAGAPLAEAGCP